MLNHVKLVPIFLGKSPSLIIAKLPPPPFFLAENPHTDVFWRPISTAECGDIWALYVDAKMARGDLIGL